MCKFRCSTVLLNGLRLGLCTFKGKYEYSLSIIISFWPRWVLEAFALNFIYLYICKITISKKQIHMRTKGVFCMSVKLCVWTSGSHEDMMAQLLSRYRDQSLKKYFSPRPLFLSCFGTPAEGRTLSWSSSCLEWTGIRCLSVPGLCV